MLVLEARAGLSTAEPADADRQQRHAVRLTRVDPEAPLADGARGIPPARRDPVTDAAFVEIEWSAADALSFALCISRRIGGLLAADLAGARGNVALADHGRSAALAVPLAALPGGRVPHLAPGRAVSGPPTQQGRVRLADGETVALIDPAAGAGAALRVDPADVRPAIDLRGGGDHRRWTARRDLPASGAEAAEFVVETEDDGRAGPCCASAMA